MLRGVSSRGRCGQDVRTPSGTSDVQTVPDEVVAVTLVGGPVQEIGQPPPSSGRGRVVDVDDAVGGPVAQVDDDEGTRLTAYVASSSSPCRPRPPQLRQPPEPRLQTAPEVRFTEVIASVQFTPGVRNAIML